MKHCSLYSSTSNALATVASGTQGRRLFWHTNAFVMGIAALVVTIASAIEASVPLSAVTSVGTAAPGPFAHYLVGRHATAAHNHSPQQPAKLDELLQPNEPRSAWSSPRDRVAWSLGYLLKTRPELRTELENVSLVPGRLPVDRSALSGTQWEALWQWEDDVLRINPDALGAFLQDDRSILTEMMMHRLTSPQVRISTKDGTLRDHQNRVLSWEDREYPQNAILGGWNPKERTAELRDLRGQRLEQPVRARRDEVVERMDQSIDSLIARMRKRQYGEVEDDVQWLAEEIQALRREAPEDKIFNHPVLQDQAKLVGFASEIKLERQRWLTNQDTRWWNTLKRQGMTDKEKAVFLQLRKVVVGDFPLKDRFQFDMRPGYVWDQETLFREAEGLLEHKTLGKHVRDILPVAQRQSQRHIEALQVVDSVEHLLKGN